ncbi:MAG: hypothetical protein KQI81_08675 [Deltaproteobacteria bacterium]|nr:hypothetical protein [Deltaproteobacteria bacterium]
MGSARFEGQELHVTVTPEEISQVAILVHDAQLLNLNLFVARAAEALIRKKNPQVFNNFGYDMVAVEYLQDSIKIVYQKLEIDAVIA